MTAIKRNNPEQTPGLTGREEKKALKKVRNFYALGGNTRAVTAMPDALLKLIGGWDCQRGVDPAAWVDKQYNTIISLETEEALRAEKMLVLCRRACAKVIDAATEIEMRLANTRDNFVRSGCTNAIYIKVSRVNAARYEACIRFLSEAYQKICHVNVLYMERMLKVRSLGLKKINSYLESFPAEKRPDLKDIEKIAEEHYYNAHSDLDEVVRRYARLLEGDSVLKIVEYPKPQSNQDEPENAKGDVENDVPGITVHQDDSDHADNGETEEAAENAEPEVENDVPEITMHQGDSDHADRGEEE